MTGTDFSRAPTRAATDDSVATSLEARLADRTRDLDELTRQHAATVEILDIIASSPAGLQPVLDAVVRAALLFCGADDSSIILKEGAVAFVAAHEGPLPSPLGTRQRIERSHFLAQVILDGQTIQAPDTGALDRVDFAATVALAQEFGVLALVCAPIRHAGEVVGCLLLRRREVGPFSARQIAMLETLATQIGIAVANAGVIIELREALDRQTATAEILQIISRSLTDVRPVLDTVVETAARFCGAEDVTIALRDGDHWVGAAHVGPIRAVTGERIPLSRETIMGRAIIDGCTMHVPDIDMLDPVEFAAGRALSARLGLRAALVAPMLRDGVVIGGVNLRRAAPGSFTKRQIELAESLAAQAVIAIENVRLFTEQREALEQQTATAEILRAISQSPTDVQPVLDAVVKAALRFCGATDAIIVLREGEGAIFAAHEGPLAPVPGASIPLNRETAPGRAILDGRTCHFPDIASLDPVEFAAAHHFAAAQGFRAAVAAPLLREDSAIGAVVLRKSALGPFAPQQIELLESFAAQAVIAIENVRLFTELKESLEQQTVTSEILRAIAQSPTDAQPVFDVIAQSALRLLNGWSVLIWRYDGERMRVIASHGGSPGTDAASVRAALGEPRPEDLAYPGDAILKRTILQITDSEAAGVPEGVREVAHARGWRANIAVPMLRDAPPIGVITVSRKEPGAFAEREIGLLQTFAAQAVIAIENVRLFTELRQSLEQQTATAEVLETINASPGNPVPVFEAILAKAMTLCGADFGTFAVFDGQRLLTVATRGVPEAFAAYRRANPPAYGPATGPGRLMAGEDIVHEVDVADSEAYRRGDRNRRAIVDLGGARTILNIALRKDRALLGSMSIYSQEVRPFTENQIALLQNFAAQAVIAMENARLLTEQREALERQTATTEILQVINASPGRLGPVFDIMLDRAVRLSDSAFGIMNLYEDGRYRAVAVLGVPDGLVERWSAAPDPGPTNALTRIVNGEDIVHIEDLAAYESYLAGDKRSRALVETGGARSLLAVALRKDGVLLGTLTAYRQEVRPFTTKQMELLQSFAAQAVIAIENVRLFTELRDSLERLKAVQANLIQSEKMASLGQLTAGIAHEIKNPLNFVNNFATLSVELLDELKEVAAPALAALDGERREQVDETMSLLTGNLDKIAEHGKRADGIVRSMLSHSRGGSGDWQASNINALIEEALNLAYHGARASDKEFNVTLERDLAADTAPIEVVPQDVTRVFLNLVGNGFYAANKRRRAAGDPAFRPTLRVATRDLGDAVEVRVRDNGTGIPPEIREKLFQPFFTTKPTGEGTGLGLSISYDIVTQQHGGSIEVDSEPGAFTEFTVRLPRRRRAQGEARGQR
ncbi:MAG: GAF domain-containing protein [Reyranella sp.]|nr:GAF domain-containing protein [Reyranella sp.]